MDINSLTHAQQDELFFLFFLYFKKRVFYKKIALLCKRSYQCYLKFGEVYPIKGDIFLYGNNEDVVLAGTIDSPNGFPRANHFQDRHYSTYLEDGKSKQRQLSVDCWITSSVCDNWSRHGNHYQLGRIDSYLPVALFSNKKEGETVEFKLKNRRVVLTLAQLKYKYWRSGPFHELLQWKLDRYTLKTQGDTVDDNSMRSNRKRKRIESQVQST